MDFKQQYKTEMQNISPTEEQSAIIRARVYEEIQKPQEAQKRKKPLPLKTIAITGASAACLVLAATFALHFTPKTETLDNAMGGEAIQNGCNETAGKATNFEASPSGNAIAATTDGVLSDLGKNGASYGSAPMEIADCTAPPSAHSLPAESISRDEVTALRIELSEELSECVVYSSDKATTYALSNEAELTVDNAKLLTEIPKDRNNLGERLFVYIESNKIWVYDRNKDFLGAFVEIS